MKLIPVVFTLYLLTSSLFSQDSLQSDTSETLAYDFANYKLRLYKLTSSNEEVKTQRIKRKGKMPAKYMGIGWHSLWLVDKNFSTSFSEQDKFLETTPLYAMGMQLNILDFKLKLGKQSKGNLALVSGLGFNFNYFRLADKNQYITMEEDSIVSQSLQSASGVKRLTFRVFDIHMPLMLEWAPLFKNYRIAIGAEFSYMIQATMFSVSELNGEKSKLKRRDDFNLNTFGFSPLFEVGIRNYSVYTMINMVNFFEASKNPQLNTITLGLRYNI